MRPWGYGGHRSNNHFFGLSFGMILLAEMCYQNDGNGLRLKRTILSITKIYFRFLPCLVQSELNGKLWGFFPVSTAGTIIVWLSFCSFGIFLLAGEKIKLRNWFCCYVNHRELFRVFFRHQFESSFFKSPTWPSLKWAQMASLHFSTVAAVQKTIFLVWILSMILNWMY